MVRWVRECNHEGPRYLKTPHQLGAMPGKEPFDHAVSITDPAALRDGKTAEVRQLWELKSFLRGGIRNRVLPPSSTPSQHRHSGGVGWVFLFGLCT